VSVTTVDLDPELVARAKAASGQTTVKGAITVALTRLVEEAERRGDAADWPGLLDSVAAMESLTDLLDPEIRARARR
jgi:Arc/MetJ family transcription regulator